LFLERLAVFRFYSYGGTAIGKSLLLLGLVLVVLGVLVFILREILAVVAAAILVVAGLGFWATGLRILWHSRHMPGKQDADQGYRENVRVRGSQDSDAQ